MVGLGGGVDREIWWNWEGSRQIYMVGLGGSGQRDMVGLVGEWTEIWWDWEGS